MLSECGVLGGRSFFLLRFCTRLLDESCRIPFGLWFSFFFICTFLRKCCSNAESSHLWYFVRAKRVFSQDIF